MPRPLPIRSVHHIARSTQRLEAMRAFYRDVLGFREIQRPTFSFPGAWLYNYGVQIHLIVNDEAPQQPGDISTRAAHVALFVDDVAEVARLLEEHGLPFKTNTVPQTGVTQLFFHDPDGNHIEIGCYPPVPAFVTTAADERRVESAPIESAPMESAQ